MDSGENIAWIRKPYCIRTDETFGDESAGGGCGEVESGRR
nr:MAG TPA: hypothetical protein [Myoviridae sp. ctict13]